MKPALPLFQKTLLDSESNVDSGDFSWNASDLELPETFDVSVSQRTLSGGKQQGSRLIELNVGDTRVRVIPTRGMGILDVHQQGVRYGWDSPVKEIVHPAFMQLESSAGLGWLDGFNEMLVRCGYQWAGHPGQDGDAFLTLHGRIQNTPASHVTLTVEQQPPYRITLSGRVDEKRFKFSDFEVWMNLSLIPGEPYLYIEDTLTNLSAYPKEYQVIYHNNFAQPILEPGARLHVPLAEISPFNDCAARELDNWDSIMAPRRGFDERVYNLRPLSDAQGMSYALLHNAVGDKAIEIAYHVDQLPVLTFWKNTDLIKQGYVVGIEPGTSFSYNRRYQRSLGLVPVIQPESSVSFSLRFGFLTNKNCIQQSMANIESLQNTVPVTVKKTPLVISEKS